MPKRMLPRSQSGNWIPNHSCLRQTTRVNSKRATFDDANDEHNNMIPFAEQGIYFDATLYKMTCTDILLWNTTTRTCKNALDTRLWMRKVCIGPPPPTSPSTISISFPWRQQAPGIVYGSATANYYCEYFSEAVFSLCTISFVFVSFRFSTLYIRTKQRLEQWFF